MANIKETIKENIEMYLDASYASLEKKEIQCYDLEEIQRTDYLNAELAEKIIKLKEEILRLQGNTDAYENVLRDLGY